jgi:hypothetical protein
MLNRRTLGLLLVAAISYSTGRWFAYDKGSKDGYRKCVQDVQDGNVRYLPPTDEFDLSEILGRLSPRLQRRILRLKAG